MDIGTLSGCGIASADKSMNRDLVRREFSKLAKTYARSRGPEAFREAREFTHWIGLSPDEWVLDAASGPGVLAKAMASAARSPVFALDVSFRMLDLARRQQPGRNLAVAVGDVQSLPFASASFDVVTCTYSFANFPDPSQVLREFARVTRPDGKIGIIDVTAPSDPAENQRLNELESSRSHIYTHLLTCGQFDDLFASVGLKLKCWRVYRSHQRFRDWLRLSPAIDPHEGHRIRERVLKDGEPAPDSGAASREFLSYFTAWFLLQKSLVRPS